MGTVWRGVHVQQSVPVAVKVLSSALHDGLRLALEREVRAMASLVHPRVVLVLGYGLISPEAARSGELIAGSPWIAMELGGDTLAAWARQTRPWDQTRDAVLQVLDALAHAHARGLTHRDLKLSNVLISSKGRAELADFGLASMINAEDDKEFANAPNPRSIDYAGLERATNVPRNDVRSDIFFVGCMLYHMLSGRPPLAETRDRMQRLYIGRYRDIPPLGKYVKGLPQMMINIINRSLAFDPTMRYPNYDPFIADLAKVQDADAVLLQRAVETNEDDESTDDNIRGGVIQQEGEDMTILVVDSRQSMQDVLRAQLGKRGYRVLFVSNAERAIQRLKDSPGEFDCAVFCTGELGESALNVFNQLDDDHVTSKLPALIIVEKNQASFASQARLSDLHSLLQQPVKVRELRAALVKVISRRNPV